MMKISDLLKFSPEEGKITFDDRRMFIMEAAGMGLLRRELIETLGATRAHGLLFRFGFQFGANDAESLRKTRKFATAREWWEAGPPMRAMEGIAAVQPRRVVFHPEAHRFDVELVLRNSYESETSSENPGCWMMSGFASGHASRCFGEKVIFIEEHCVGRGDAECVLIGKRVEDWGDRAKPYLKYLEGESVERLIDEMQSELETLRAEIEATCSFSNIVGRSPATVKVLGVACDVARTEATVLLLGESGTGKELLARAVHYNSRRRAGPFLAVNCAAIHDSLLESELFGHEKGAFTGADKTTPGKFERAAGGTLFLDEIGDMNVMLQAKVLRVLQEREFERVGGSKVMRADARVIAATNRNLAEMVRDRSFREDLYYRVNGFPITIPPLRARREDILPLAGHFLKRLCTETGKPIPPISSEAQEQLLEHSWPGNVRELQNAIERAVILSRGEEIKPLHLGFERSSPKEVASGAFTLPAAGVSIDEVEKDLLVQAMERAGRNKTSAAKLLGLTRSTLRYRLKKFGLDA